MTGALQGYTAAAGGGVGGPGGPGPGGPGGPGGPIQPVSKDLMGLPNERDLRFTLIFDVQIVPPGPGGNP